MKILLGYMKGVDHPSFCAEHDQIWCEGPDPKNMKTEDVDRLSLLGWSYEDDMGWHKFV